MLMHHFLNHFIEHLFRATSMPRVVVNLPRMISFSSFAPHTILGVFPLLTPPSGAHILTPIPLHGIIIGGVRVLLHWSFVVQTIILLLGSHVLFLIAFTIILRSVIAAAAVSKNRVIDNTIGMFLFNRVVIGGWNMVLVLSRFGAGSGARSEGDVLALRFRCSVICTSSSWKIQSRVLKHLIDSRNIGLGSLTTSSRKSYFLSNFIGDVLHIDRWRFTFTAIQLRKLLSFRGFRVVPGLPGQVRPVAAEAPPIVEMGVLTTARLMVVILGSAAWTNF